MATSPRQGARRGSGPTSRPARRPQRDAGGPRLGDVITALVAEPLEAAGFDLEGVVVRRSGDQHVVQISVDRDGGLDLDAVADASRLVSGVLDAHDAELPAALRDAYVLEVSSRGTSEPLVLPRHWRRAVSRLVKVSRAGAQSVVGRIVAADDDGADLDVDGEAVRVAYADVTKALVQLEFKRPAGLDGAGDDEIDEHEGDELDDLTDDEDDEEETP